MPLSWNEIRSRAHAFSHKWAGEASERAEAQSFWNDFFAVFGIERRRVAIFEKQVQIARADKKLKHGRIDASWKGMLLIEHKSQGADLNRAFAQAADYSDYRYSVGIVYNNFPWPDPPDEKSRQALEGLHRRCSLPARTSPTPPSPTSTTH